MTEARRWEFGYAPVRPAAEPEEAGVAHVVASFEPILPERLADASGPEARAETLLCRAPLFWTRVLLPAAASTDELRARLHAAGVPTRYVASAARPSLPLAPALDVRRELFARPRAWPARAPGPPPSPPTSPGTWFLRDAEGGVAVDRARCGVGVGRRLAVIDDDALEAERVELDAEILVEIDRAPRHGTHGPLMVAWAAGAKGFAGVAPGVSARLYLIPKPGLSVIGLPLAIARAVFDGADVIVCATYVEGSTSPMLDDALEVAARLGRRGRGAAVVLPTGRETSSVAGSVHASFSLGLGEPASDPRVFCVGPSGRGGGWFLWRDRKGRLRPFANRGPAVRWLAPGDDIAYPFGADGALERLYHAESSGASAVAAGVIALVLAANPTLRRAELAALIDATTTVVTPEVAPDQTPLADPSDILPGGLDADGHNAKHGLGLIHATRACLAASDPVSAALVAMGEDRAAAAWADLRRAESAIRATYSTALARWAVRALLADRDAAEALRVLVRHLRLVDGDAQRLRSHGSGVIIRAVALLLRRLATARPAATRAVRREVGALARRLEEVARDPGATARLEEGAAVALARCFSADAPSF